MLSIKSLSTRLHGGFITRHAVYSVNWVIRLRGFSIQSEPEKPDANFVHRHIGPSDEETLCMLEKCGVKSMDELLDKTIPKHLRFDRTLNLPETMSEAQLMSHLEKMMQQNEVWRSYIGQGYYGTITPTPILRNVFENPGWYTAYTPYQPEISQGRLEALLNFQTMVSDLTALPLANASLLDEGTAAAEAMNLAVRRTGRDGFIVDLKCHPQTIDVVRSRAEGLKLNVTLMDTADFDKFADVLATGSFAGCLVQYPDTHGNVCMEKLKNIIALTKQYKTLSVTATDLLALTMIQPPGALGFDITVGSSQRFGVPMAFGGPHAAFFATKEEFARLIPGRIIGISKDSRGTKALRLALQVREQHIRRDKATSNICTAQALLASMASLYAVYHGPKGLRQTAERVHRNTLRLAGALSGSNYQLLNKGPVFDTILFKPLGGQTQLATIRERAAQKKINLRYYPNNEAIGISLDETVTDEDFRDILYIFGADLKDSMDVGRWNLFEQSSILRDQDYLGHQVFNSYHSETEFVRYVKCLENKDLSLVHSMIPLGSCTMKLNGTTSLMPCSWSQVNCIHPFAPVEQTKGFSRLIQDLETYLSEITGYDHVCLTPNSGAQGEYAGLCAITGYLASKGESGRRICLIPKSAHGTNPASATLAGMIVQPVKNLKNGTIDMGHLKEQLSRFEGQIGAMMITYPSTFGVFDEDIVQTCELVHQAGAQVYLDGANMNAQVGLCRPGDYGTDVSHLNLHKTFGIPHGGGGPGIGPVCVKSHLVPFLPQHPWRSTHSKHLEHSMNPDSMIRVITSAPFGSAGILPIPWTYIRLLGARGLRKASEVAILNANYMLRRLHEHYPIKFANKNGCCAHEFIVDCSPFEKHHVTTLDIAKRLMDYGFHSPTMSWPVASSLMIEPTESESLRECDRFCDAMISIRQEIDKIASGQWPKDCNPLKLAPHTLADITDDTWNRPYSRYEAAYPAPWLNPEKTISHSKNKIWPTVGRLDDAYGDTHLICKTPINWD